MRIKKYMFITLLLTGWVINLGACTIFSGKDKKGNVWTGNNEDYLFTFNTYLHLITGSDSTFGHAFFTYGKINEYIQGGVNEAGLFFDANSVAPSKYKDYDTKKDFPGGYNAMLSYILKKCKTVPEVLSLFEKYRLDGLQSGQLHFADKHGNLGIIVADSMWITQANYQVSTNYNLSHPNKDEITCWRFPIAERILQAKEPGLDSFREICDSTSQKKITSTIFSNIHNLTTGDIWFYYGMDYSKPCKTNLKELLKKGSRSFLIYELFTESPLVAVYKTYQSEGIKAGLKKLDEYQLPMDRKNEILRLLCSDLIVFNHDFNSYPFLSDLIKSKKEKTDDLVKITNALVFFCEEKKDEALNELNKYLAENPKSKTAPLAQEISNHMQGIFEKDANIKFELEGYEKARYVFVEGLDVPNIKYFLIRKNGKWIGEFKLEPDEYHYIFLVDGKKILDPKNPDIITDSEPGYNRLIVKK